MVHLADPQEKIRGLFGKLPPPTCKFYVRLHLNFLHGLLNPGLTRSPIPHLGDTGLVSANQCQTASKCQKKNNYVCE